MELPSSEIVKVIYALLPGFLTAWVFYGLTAHPRQGTFERVVQALIFTGIVQAAVLILRESMLFLGRHILALGLWTDDRAFVVSIVAALLLGLFVARLANKDAFHRFLRENKWLKYLWLDGITMKTSFSSEWFSALSKDKRYLVLHLNGKRRLYGWPLEWPDQPDSGHFVIMEPEWVLDDNSRAPLHTVERLVVAAKDVEMVECLKFPVEVKASPDELSSIERTLVQLQKEENDGEQRGS